VIAFDSADGPDFIAAFLEVTIPDADFETVSRHASLRENFTAVARSMLARMITHRCGRFAEFCNRVRGSSH
jgi:hypothetical protein